MSKLLSILTEIEILMEDISLCNDTEHQREKYLHIREELMNLFERRH